MAVQVTYVSKLTVEETLADTLISTSDKKILFNGLDTTTSFNSGSSPDAELHAAFRKTLSSGTGTIDLRALVGTNGGAIDGNGKKVRAIKFKAKSDNANPITITPGASNGYDIFGSASSITLSAGCEALFYFADSAVAIDATHKTIDLAGTGSQVMDVEVVIG